MIVTNFDLSEPVIGLRVDLDYGGDLMENIGYAISNSELNRGSPQRDHPTEPVVRM